MTGKQSGDSEYISFLPVVVYITIARFESYVVFLRLFIDH